MSEILSSVIDVTRDERVTTAPSSKGNQIKWRTKTGLWLKADDFGYEGLAEAAAARLLRISNIQDYVWYDPCVVIEDGVEYRGCVSKDFLAPDEVLVTICRLYETHGLDAYAEFEGESAAQRLSGLIDTVSSLTKLRDFGPWLGKLLEFDAFILNEDRHLHNLAVILKADKSFRLMTVFDNGAAFLSDTRRDYPFSIPTVRLINKVRSKPIVTHFDKQLDAVREVVGLSLKFGDVAGFDIGDCDQYTREEIVRVSQIIKIQKARYPYLFDKGRYLCEAHEP